MAARREQRTVWLTGTLLLLLVVAAVPLLARRLPDGGNVVIPDSPPMAAGIVVNPPTDAVPFDSASDSLATARDTGRAKDRSARDTGARLAASSGRLTVTTPAEASVTLDGIPITAGKWQGDSLRPGDHEIVATLRTIPGCETASVTRAVRVRAGGSREETLTPRPCGFLDLVGRNNTRGQYIVSAADGGLRREGAVPLANPLVLPAGRYLVKVVKTPDGTDYCAPYEAEFEVKPDATSRATFSFLCGAK